MHATGLDLNLNNSALWNIARLADGNISRLADGLKSTASNLCGCLSLAARTQLGKLREADLANPTRYYEDFMILTVSTRQRLTLSIAQGKVAPAGAAATLDSELLIPL